MKLTEEELINLARLAKPVPVEPDGKARRKPKVDISEVSAFMEATQLKPGRNPVAPNDIYNVFMAWSTKPLENITFLRGISKYFKKDNGNFKLNMKLITLEEIVKGLRNENKEKSQKSD